MQALPGYPGSNNLVRYWDDGYYPMMYDHNVQAILSVTMWIQGTQGSKDQKGY